MPAQTLILIGPARCGKTTRLLADYRKALTAGEPGCALWLGPNRQAVAAVFEQLMGGPLCQCASPQCLTFGKFTQTLLDASAAPLRPLTEFMKRRLLRELIARGKASGQLLYFAPIADTPGLLQLVSQTIREWKRLEIWPAELATAHVASGLSQKDRELLWLYEEYQRLLNDNDLYDAQGKFWLARTQLREMQRPFERLRQVFVDGFTDFTRTEIEMLTILAERVEQVTVTLPSDGTNQPRTDLFAKALRTFDELRRRFPQASVKVLGRPVTGWPSMDHIEANLFRSPSEVQLLSDATGVDILVAAGQLNEMEGLARRIKQLLTAGDAAHVISPQDILVVFRSLGDVAPLVREVFSLFGIPTAVETRNAVSEAACVSALVAWLRLAVEDWPFRRLLTTISHNSFHPGWPEWQSGRAVLALEQLVREFQIPDGRMELVRRIARIAELPKENELAPQAGSDLERRRTRARLAAPLVERLSQCLSELPKSATASEWCISLSALANQLGISRLVTGSKSEESAWKAVMTSLRSMDRLATWRNTKVAKFSLRELFDLVTEITECESIPPQHDEIGRVRIVSATSARSLTAPYVFLAGLTEKAFPAAEREDRLFSEAETAQLAAEGLPLATRVERSQAEMLLFYEVATRATRRLIMSYPGLDAKAQPLSPSPYLVELQRACGESSLTPQVDLQLSPVPREREILCERDHRIRAVADAMEGDRKLLAGIIQTNRLEPVSNILTAITTIHARSHVSDFGPFEGVFWSDAARAKLTERFGHERCWSPSQLEKYAYCPFQFFAERVMRLEPLGELSLEVNHRLRGKLLHGTLSGLHRKIIDEAGNLVSPATQTPADFERSAAEVLTTLLEKFISDDPVVKALQEIDRRVLGEWLANYYAQHQDYDELWTDFELPIRPAHFEVSFGPTHDSADNDPDDVPVDCDTLTTLRPLELKHGNESVHMRGRIDRIDVGKIGGRTVFNVIDYKSASDVKLSGETVADGRTLQLPLYALAVEQLLLADRQAVPWRASYWLVKEKGFRHRSALAFYQLVDGQLEPDPAWTTLRDQLLARVVSLVRAIRDGQFPMHCADDKCTGRCPYHTVCRVGQVRSLEKKWQPPEAES